MLIRARDEDAHTITQSKQLEPIKALTLALYRPLHQYD